MKNPIIIDHRCCKRAKIDTTTLRKSARKSPVVVVLPNKDVDLGVVAPHQQTDACIMVRELSAPFGRDREAYIAPAKNVF
jgi:hypothetical protein